MKFKNFHKRMVFYTLVIISLTAVLFMKHSGQLCFGAKNLTYEELRKDGIVSGFGNRDGNPLDYVNSIPSINSPKYITPEEDMFKKEEIFIGLETKRGWRFSSLSILNGHEIVNNDDNSALCFCPLAGLVVAMPGKKSVSGLLKYDTFVIYDDETKNLIFPFTGNMYQSDQKASFVPVQRLTFGAILDFYSDAKVLNPKYYRSRNPYGTYSTNRDQGLGHAKPGLQKEYRELEIGFHPKENVLLVGDQDGIWKGYPFSELNKNVPSEGGSFQDQVQGRDITVHYYPQYSWAFAEDENGGSLNRGYAYIFALYQHMPDISLYKSSK